MTYTGHLKTIGHAFIFPINHYDLIKKVVAYTMKKIIILDHIHGSQDHFQFTRFLPNISNIIILKVTVLLTNTIRKLRLFLI